VEKERGTGTIAPGRREGRVKKVIGRRCMAKDSVRGFLFNPGSAKTRERKAASSAYHAGKKNSRELPKEEDKERGGDAKSSSHTTLRHLGEAVKTSAVVVKKGRGRKEHRTRRKKNGERMRLAGLQEDRQDKPSSAGIERR